MKLAKPVLTITTRGACLVIGLFFAAVGLWAAFAFIPSLVEAPFYKNSGSGNADLLPLIQPYRAVRFFDDDPTSWSIELRVGLENPKGLYYFQITDVAKIAIQNNIIMVYTPYSRSLTAEDKRIGLGVLHWFVIIPDKKLETGFETEDEFLVYIHTLGIGNPSWIEPDIAFQQFVKTRCLDWIPGCR